MNNNEENLSKINKLLFNSILETFDLRKPQIRTMEWLDKPLKAKKKFIILEAPPGTGKSLISQLFIKKIKEEYNKSIKFDLLTCTKDLQQQYIDTFPYISNLWGKSNYHCEKYDNNCEYGKECNNKKGETPCESCPHNNAIERWLSDDISMTNFHIHGIYSLYKRNMIEQRNSDILIVDECHTLESTINGFVSFKLSKKIWSKYVDTTVSNELEESLFNLETLDELSSWLKSTFIPTLKASKVKFEYEIPNLEDNKLTEQIKIINSIESLIDVIETFLNDFNQKISKWVIDKKTDNGHMVWDIQPRWVGDIIKKNIWDNYNTIFLMSGTIVDINLFCTTNGIPIDDVALLKLPSPFPKNNRPVYYLPLGRMTYKNKHILWDTYKETILKILKKYKGKKGIIHCGNYELWDWMKNDIKDSRLIFASPDDRQQSIDRHINATNDSVIVSPSLKQGIDLKDDLSRFQVILKIPYPSLASKVNKERIEDIPTWYSWVTIMDILQLYGRSIRSETDYADTIILDECFSDIIRQYDYLFPSYFKEAIIKKKL